MTVLRRVVRRLSASALGRRNDQRLREELAEHLALLTDEYVRAGLLPAEARRQASIKLGVGDAITEAYRDEERMRWLEDFARDARHSARMLWRVPGYSIVTILTLALGIGAATAVFTVVNGVLLKPLPYPEADALVDLRHLAPGLDLSNGSLDLSHTQFFTYRQHNRVFQHIGLWLRGTAAVLDRNEARQVQSLQVTEGTLDALGVRPALGRWFTREDDSPESPETVVLSHDYWQRMFGGDAGILGRSITVDSRPRRVIGVMSAGFQFVGATPDVVLPFRFDHAKLFLGNFNYRGFARLRPGVSVAAANADVARMVPIWLHAWPAPGGARPFFENARFTPALRPLKDVVVGDITNVLWVLFGTVGLVLLIACANVANLVLVRVEGRQQEMAVRLALGARRGRLARALLTESLVLGLAGGAIGLVLAVAGVRAIVALAPAALPRLDDIAIDAPVLVFTVLASLASALICGVLPLLHRRTSEVVDELRSSGRTATHGRERRRLRGTFVVVQMSLATVLLVAAGLMIRTFVALTQVQPGFTDASHVQLARILIPQTVVADPLRVFGLQTAVRDRLAAIPGVRAVSFASEGPMQLIGTGDPVFVEGSPPSTQQMPPVREFKFVAPGYFDTVGTRVIAGRDITWHDLQSRSPVAMVAESLARELWGDTSAAVGRRIREHPQAVWREVVGVVEDVRDNGLHVPAPSTAYWPALAANFQASPVAVRRAVTFVLRTDRAGTESLLSDMHGAVRGIHGGIPLADVTTLDVPYQRALAPTAFTLVILAIAGAMALTIALVGIYGVLSYAVTQRVREIGIRAALGAPAASLRTLFVRDGLVLAAAGIGCGLLVAGMATRVMASLLIGVTPLDLVTYGAVAVVLAAVAGGAAYVPARRATVVDPIEVLRAE